MKYLINGVDGGLGGVIANEALTLLDPKDLIFAAPDLERINKDNLKKWTDLGVSIKEASYDNYDQMVEVYQGVDRLLLISTWLIGEARRIQHRNAIRAAKAAGVGHIIYTSFNGAEIEENTPIVAYDHRDTEKAIVESGIEYTLQRNMLYFFYPLSMIQFAINNNNSEWVCNSHGEKAAWVDRDDCARVAAALLAGKGEPYKAYLVTGPELLSEKELFDIGCEYLGQKVNYQYMSTEDTYKYWEEKGVPRTVHGDFSKSPLPICTDDLVGNGDSVGSGHFAKVTNVVEELTGRKPTSVREGVKFVFQR